MLRSAELFPPPATVRRDYAKSLGLHAAAAIGPMPFRGRQSGQSHRKGVSRVALRLPTQAARRRSTVRLPATLHALARIRRPDEFDRIGNEPLAVTTSLRRKRLERSSCLADHLVGIGHPVIEVAVVDRPASMGDREAAGLAAPLPA